MGYEAYRELVFARQKELGIFPEHAELTPINPYVEEKSADGKPWNAVDVVRPWDSLSADEQRLFCRMAEVYAGFLSHTDHEIGRLLDFLEESGQLENTIVVFVSDNGASGEGGPNGSVNENKLFNGIPDTIEENLRQLDELGSPSTYNHYPVGWAWAFNTPFKMWKRYNFEGGVADPMIVSWPKGIAARGELRRQFLHATDVVPTVYDLLGVELPEVVKGYQQVPLEGVSFRSTFESDDVPTPKESAFFSMLGSRAVWHRGWKAVSVHPTIAGWGRFERDRWGLYDTERDPTESHDLAAENPVKLEEMINHWFHLAGLYNGLPLLDRTAVEVLADPTRPQVAPPRERYVYYPDAAEVPEAAAVNIRNRSYSIAVDVKVDSEDAAGVLFSHGARFGGHALYVADRKLKYAYNFRRRAAADGRVDARGSDGQADARRLLRSRGGDDAGERHALALHRRREGRRGPYRDAARQLLARGRRAERRQGPGLARDGRLSRDEPLCLHGRNDQGGRRRRLRRALRRPRARGARDDEARVASPIAG
jgi:hypothetical protein